MEDVDLLGKETAVIKQRRRNMAYPEVEIQPAVLTRWLVERIIKYEIREVGRSQLASFKMMEEFCFGFALFCVQEAIGGI